MVLSGVAHSTVDAAKAGRRSRSAVESASARSDPGEMRGMQAAAMAAGAGVRSTAVKELTDILAAAGAALVGFADLSPLDENLRRGFLRAVSVGIALDPQIVAGIRSGPTDAYCLEYDRVNEKLTNMADQAALWLRARGFPAEGRPASHDWDRTSYRSPFQHKTAATLAGLGWIGKCALLVTPQYGSAVRWATVLTDAPLPTGNPIVKSRCGECRACVDACPGDAASGRHWQQGMSREEFWDYQACMRGMREINVGRDNSRGVCGLCIATCPHTVSYLKRAGAMLDT